MAAFGRCCAYFRDASRSIRETVTCVALGHRSATPVQGRTGPGNFCLLRREDRGADTPRRAHRVGVFAAGDRRSRSSCGYFRRHVRNSRNDEPADPRRSVESARSRTRSLESRRRAAIDGRDAPPRSGALRRCRCDRRSSRRGPSRRRAAAASGAREHRGTRRASAGPRRGSTQAPPVGPAWARSSAKSPTAALTSAGKSARSWTWRTSITSLSEPGQREAHAIASSRDFTSIIQ